MNTETFTPVKVCRESRESLSAECGERDTHAPYSYRGVCVSPRSIDRDGIENREGRESLNLREQKP